MNQTCFICQTVPAPSKSIEIRHNTKNWTTCFKTYCVTCFGSWALCKDRGIKQNMEPDINCIDCGSILEAKSVRQAMNRYTEEMNQAEARDCEKLK